jgi:hypothetical protein
VKVEIEPGWGVYTNDGQQLGGVGEVGTDFFTVRTGLLGTHELYVPTSVIAMVLDDRVELNLDRDEVDAQSWDRPPTRPL